ncbi:quinol cytochrome c oxidoreductase quinone-binding subunit 2 [Ferriphaselus amnicola]|jgi:hypothetical protein|uniref:Quinol cytochrome c oxidoreductase quinone-binding subunit 2 n=1 Tax=Ferriphaselus amnicola TaxID=1188319 RepID=A0A2Z6GA66_9PROT|nr:hypothetical protein [Ferriphaselus amnicola]BBE50239.1 quinol cytochrome c oxidoreductase quinone-binding subunit 2 [Ferriphaselus amnicola]
MSYYNWSVVTVSFLVVLSLSLGGVALTATLHLVGARWQCEVRGLAKSLFALFPLAFVLLLVLLAGGSNTFPWLGHLGSNVHMPGWYTLPLLAAREIIGMLFMGYLCSLYIKRQDVADRSDADRERFHDTATWIPFFYVLYGTMVSWDFEMTLMPSWHSAIYGLQNIVSNFGMYLSFLVVWVFFLNASGKLRVNIKDHIPNYIAQMLFAFTLLWVYTFFAQYLTIWYGNLPDETDRIYAMQDGNYTFLWWSMIFLKFVIPFVTFCFPGPRHSLSAINFVAVCIIIGTLFERFNWVAGMDGKGTMPLLAVLVVGGVVSTIGYHLVRSAMRKNQLLKV